MADTFGQLWRRVQLYNPDLPPELSKRFVQVAFRSLLQHPRLWSWAVDTGQFVFPAVYSTGTVTMTEGSTTVTGSGTVWTSSHEGLQFKVGGFVYTVSTVNNNTELIVDASWGLPTAAGQGYQILKAYVTAPTDFGSWLSIVDVDNNRRIRTNVSLPWLDTVDSERASSGTPAIIVPRSYDSSGVPRFEVWPHVAEAKVMPYHYYKEWADISDALALPYSVSGETLEDGALEQLCLWPGTIERPNPMFSVRNAAYYRERFQRGILDLARDDEDIHANEIWDSYLDFPYVPLDARYIQRHAV